MSSKRRTHSKFLSIQFFLKRRRIIFHLFFISSVSFLLFQNCSNKTLTDKNSTLSSTVTPLDTSSPTVSTTETSPDVIVTSVSYNATTGIFTSVVKNQGTAATPDGVYVGVSYSVDGTYRSWGSVMGPLAGPELLSLSALEESLT